MSVDGHFEDFEFELKEFFEILYEFDGSFDRSLGFVESDFNNVEVDVFGEIFLKVIKIINFVKRKIEDNFLELLEFWQRFGDHIHLNFLQVIIFKIQVNFF